MKRMAERPEHPCVPMAQVGDVTVGSFGEPHLLAEPMCRGVGEELLELGRELRGRKLVLNLANATRTSRAFLAYAAALHEMLAAQGGRLALCQVHPEVRRLLGVLHLDQLFAVYDTEQDALQSFW
jgi:anti-anti-sigma regulatory factor